MAMPRWQKLLCVRAKLLMFPTKQDRRDLKMFQNPFAELPVLQWKSAFKLLLLRAQSVPQDAYLHPHIFSLFIVISGFGNNGLRITHAFIGHSIRNDAVLYQQIVYYTRPFF